MPGLKQGSLTNSELRLLVREFMLKRPRPSMSASFLKLRARGVSVSERRWRKAWLEEGGDVRPYYYDGEYQ